MTLTSRISGLPVGDGIQRKADDAPPPTRSSGQLSIDSFWRGATPSAGARPWADHNRSASEPAAPGGPGDGPILRQADPVGAAIADPGSAFEGATSGRAGPLPFRPELERAFGEDFGGVEAHLGGAAATTGLTELGARAATRGERIAFNTSTPDKELVAHEVAHVVQHRRGRGGATALKSSVSMPGDATEVEADAAAAAAVRGEPARVRHGADGIQRTPLGQIANFFADLGYTEEQAQQDIAAFRARNFPALTNNQPSSGTGMFDAAFDAASGTMTITMRMLFNFVQGDPAAIGSPAGFRPEEYQWTPAEQESWKQRYLTQMGQRWSGQFVIRNTREFWDAVRVNVNFQVVDQMQVITTAISRLLSDPMGALRDASAAQGNLHFIATVGKYPPDAIRFPTSSIARPGRHHDPANPGFTAANEPGQQWGTARLDSNDLREEDKGRQRPDGSARTEASYSVTFRPFTNTYTSDGRAQLALAKTDLLAKVPQDGFANITGYASTDLVAPGRAEPVVSPAERAIQNMDAARRRSAKVQGEFASAGVAADKLLVRNAGDAEGKLSTDPTACRVDVQVVQGATQMPATHEMGHQVGEDDEYVAAGPQSAAYKQMVREAGGGEVASAQDASLMSGGNQMNARNYAPFVEALTRITGMERWSL